MPDKSQRKPSATKRVGASHSDDQDELARATDSSDSEFLARGAPALRRAS